MTTAVLVALGLVLVFVGGAAGNAASPTEASIVSDRSVDVPTDAVTSPGVRPPSAAPDKTSAGAPAVSAEERAGIPARDTAPAKRRETVRPAIRDEHADGESDDADRSDDSDEDAGADEDEPTSQPDDDADDDVDKDRPAD